MPKCHSRHSKHLDPYLAKVYKELMLAELLPTWLLIISFNLLLQPMWNSVDILTRAGSAVVYTSSHPCRNEILVTIGGECFVDGQKFWCESLGLGPDVMRMLPWIHAIHTIFYGLVVVASTCVLLFQLVASKEWCAARELRAYRLVTILVLDMAFGAGTLAVILDLALLAIPLRNAHMNTLVDGNVGWGQILTIVMTIGVGFVTMAFSNDSKEAVRRSEGSLLLTNDVECMAEEVSPLLPATEAYHDEKPSA